MADQGLKQLFLQTSSPHDNIRKNAEEQLKTLEKNVDFLNYVRNVLMKESDKIVQHITSVYFMVTIEKNWKAPELAAIVLDLENTILMSLMTEDKYPKLAYQKVLQCIFENSDKEKVEKIFVDSGRFISSQNPLEVNAALMLYEEIFKSEGLRFNLEDFMDIMFNKLGNAFTSKFTELLASKKYLSAGTCMKIISKAYSNYSLPDFLIRIEVFTGFFQLAIQILKITEKSTESILKIQKWASYFLYKSANKGLKKYFKSSELIAFIRSEATTSSLYAVFSDVLAQYLNGTTFDEKVPITLANFFTLFASNKHTKQYVKKNYMFLISSFVLPAQGYDEDAKEAFEYNHDSYLSERYNYYSNDLKIETAELFEEILHCDKEIEGMVISSLQRFLDNQTNDSNASVRYAIVGLLAGTQKSLIKQLSKDGYSLFVKKYIFTDLNSSYPFLISQSLHFLSLTESFDDSDNYVIEALSRIVTLSNGDNPVLAVEACLSLNCFFYNESLRAMFKPIIASLFEKVLGFTKQYFIESLSTLSDSIIDCFTEDISAYAPLFVQSICSSFMDRINEDKEENVPVISGCLSTIEKLIMTADDKPEIISNIYASASTIIYYVFKNQKFDFFQECFDLMNSFLFVTKSINQSMFEIFNTALDNDKEELALYPREVADFIDNYLTFGKDTMINQKTLETIFNTLNVFIPVNSAEEEIYDEDFEAGCRIIDSLMLNAGTAAVRTNPNLLPAIVHRVVSNYDFANTYDALPLFALESIMNCFIVSPEITLANLAGFTQTFFSQIEAHKDLFKRVYDKKLFVLFAGSLFKVTETLPMNFEAFSRVFAQIITTLPDAINKRAKLQKQEENSDYSDEDEGSDYSIEDIYEDIYFVTILDDFNAFEYLKNILSSIQPNTIGQKVLVSMKSEHISQIKSVLDASQVAQK